MSIISEINQDKVNLFVERLISVLNSGGVAIMLSIGHRTGLLDAMSKLPPATSEKIARAAKLDERYVREWLGAMVTGQIVNYDAENKTYKLPAEHAAVLTRASEPNMAATMQWIPLVASVEDKVVECFRNGGGVPYSAYPRFHEVMAEESGQTVLPALIDAILPLAAGLTEKLEAGIEVLDIGCGSGRALNLMAEAFPNSRFTGYDFSAEGIERARREAETQGLKNVRFEVKDAATLNEFERYDLVTAFDVIHDQARPDAVLRELYLALKQGGTFLMQDIAGSSHVHKDIDHPVAPFMYTVSCLHCMTVSLSAGGAGLGAMWGVGTAKKMLAEAGFKSVRIEQLPHDILNYYYVISKN